MRLALISVITHSNISNIRHYKNKINNLQRNSRYELILWCEYPRVYSDIRHIVSFSPPAVEHIDYGFVFMNGCGMTMLCRGLCRPLAAAAVIMLWWCDWAWYGLKLNAFHRAAELGTAEGGVGQMLLDVGRIFSRAATCFFHFVLQKNWLRTRVKTLFVNFETNFHAIHEYVEKFLLRGVSKISSTFFHFKICYIITHCFILNNYYAV